MSSVSSNGSAPPSVMMMDDLSPGGQENTALSEQAILVEKKRRVDIKTAARLRVFTLAMSWASVFYLGIMGIIMFALALINKNSSAFAFSLDAMLDCATSVVVIWRYSGTAASVYSASREKRACITLGALFILSCASVMTRSGISLAHKQHPKRAVVLWVISIINTFVCFGFLALKSWLARKLESITLATDAVNSGIGFIMSLSAVVSDWLYNQHEAVWYVDGVIGIICSLFMLGYGVWVIIYEVKFAKHSNGETELLDEG